MNVLVTIISCGLPAIVIIFFLYVIISIEVKNRKSKKIKKEIENHGIAAVAEILNLYSISSSEKFGLVAISVKLSHIDHCFPI